MNELTNDVDCITLLMTFGKPGPDVYFCENQICHHDRVLFFLKLQRFLLFGYLGQIP